MFMEQEVREGMGLLDGGDPGWESRIDLDDLNIASPSQCVLGQTQGTYQMGLAKFNLGFLDVPRYGFTVMHAAVGSIDNGTADFRMLTQTWKTKIAERRAAQSTTEWSESVKQTETETETVRELVSPESNRELVLI